MKTETFHKNRLPSEIRRVPLADALGRILAEDLTAPADVPSFRRSARDGFAVRSSDAGLSRASAEHPAILPVCGCNCAGETHVTSLPAGMAVRIMTGAYLPDGADCVVMFEECGDAAGITGAGTLDGGPAGCAASSEEEEHVTIPIACASGRFVEMPGSLFKKGTLLAPAGMRIDAKTAAAAAAAGYAELPVFEEPDRFAEPDGFTDPDIFVEVKASDLLTGDSLPKRKIVFFTVGDELAEPGGVKRFDQIYENHRIWFYGRLRDEGFDVRREDFLLIPDDFAAITAAVKAAADSGADVLITTGSSCIGDKDYLPAALKTAGAEILGRGGDAAGVLTDSPAGKVLHARLGKMAIWSLPGKPGGARAAFEEIVLPDLRESFHR